MPRFVLLYHDCPDNYERSSHWDLMFEAGEALRTWALARLPSDWSPLALRTGQDSAQRLGSAESNDVGAEQLADHRRDYLDYEGPVSGDRGRVSRVDEGTYAVCGESLDAWHVRIAGQTIQGEIKLSRQKRGAREWRLSFEAVGPRA
jgi:DNA polymerase Ligase (LigD)